MTVKEQLEKESREQIISIAQQMLLGQLHLIEGSRLICQLRRNITIPDLDDPIYDVFIMVNYETHDIPVRQPEENKYYSNMINRAHKMIEEYAQLMQPVILRACKSLILAMSDEKMLVRSS